jgi:hypothetical protein
MPVNALLIRALLQYAGLKPGLRARSSNAAVTALRLLSVTADFSNDKRHAACLPLGDGPLQTHP